MAAMPSPIYLTDDIRRIEGEAGEVKPPLMERAGAAAAELAARLASDRQKDILVVAGPGNNGGDARIVAERLREQFFRVTLLDSTRLPEEKAWGLVVDDYVIHSASMYQLCSPLRGAEWKP